MAHKQLNLSHVLSRVKIPAAVFLTFAILTLVPAADLDPQSGVFHAITIGSVALRFGFLGVLAAILVTVGNAGGVGSTVADFARVPFVVGSGTVVHNDYTYTVSTQAAVTSPTANSILTGPSVTFNWSAATGATQYYLSVGSTGVGSTNVYNSGGRDVTSWTATGLPANGETVYVRLSTDYNGLLAHSDTTYTAATAAVLTTPTPETTLSGSSVMFTWLPGTTGATQYYISVGSTGVGSSNIYNSGWRDVTSWTATGLPTNGETVYVRLSTDFGGTTVHNDYTYTAH